MRNDARDWDAVVVVAGDDDGVQRAANAMLALIPCEWAEFASCCCCSTTTIGDGAVNVAAWW